jgi:predicted dienelactone hydrolase
MRFRYLRLPRLILLVLAVLLCISIVPAVAQTAPTPEPVGQRPDAPAYALHGPYWVGTRTLEMDAGTDDAVRFTVWYPALNPDAREEAVTYLMSENHVVRTDYGFSPDEPFTVLGHALADAAPDMSGAPYPLVIHSHGFTSQMWHMYMGEHLASYGFVVLAPEHAHDSWDNLYTNEVIRMLEVTRLIDYARVLTAEGGALAGLIDADTVAAGGVSAGGMAAYGLGGAPILWSSVLDYCRQEPDDMACVNLDTQFEEIKALLGTTATADDPMPALSASPVDAIFPMAGTTEMYGEQGLADITVPMMTLFGSADPLYDWMTPAYADVSSASATQVVFLNADHNIFNNQCEAFPYILKYGVYWSCSDPVWDLKRTHDLSNHFVTAFLLDVLKGDADAHAALMPDAVSFAGIEFSTTMR